MVNFKVRDLIGEFLGFSVIFSTVYHPETDGQSENFHRSVEQVLSCYMSVNQKDLDRYLSLCQFALYFIQSATTGYSPTVVVFNREPMLPMEHNVHAITDRQVESVANHLD